MTSFYGFDGLRAMVSDRKRRLLAEAQRERVARQARRQAGQQPRAAGSHGRVPSQPEVEWGPWLQGGEPLHLSHSGAGLS